MPWKIEETLFGVIYVMTEGLAHDCTKSQQRKVFFLLIVDVLQVLRVMTSEVYGWTTATREFVSYADIVFIFSNQISRVVPRYTLYIFAVVLVSTAVANTWYVGTLFQSGTVNKMWPVKLLRLTVASTVTIYFSSVFKWLMIPMDCLVSDATEPFSSYIHGPGAPCTPFGMPEVLITAPSLLLAAIYIVFSMTTSYLAFEINPLSQQPRALFTGRVEATFQAYKIAASLLVYLSKYLTPVTITSILMLFAVWVMRKHVLVLPFHNPTTNNVRGGIIGLVVWWAVASFVMAVIFTATGGTHPPVLQSVQWVCVAFLPVGFVAGFVVTRLQQASITTTIELLKGDWEASKSEATYDSTGGKMTLRSSSFGTQQTQGATRSTAVARRNVFEKFFDASSALRTATGEEWARRFRFESEQRAVTVTRELLYRRDPESLGFLEFVISKAMDEWPESHDVMMLNLLLLRFVNRRWDEAGALERQMRLSLRSLPTDHQYTLHVVERKATQDAAGSSKMGARGQVSAVALMEFEVGMEKARKAHKMCISTMHTFWKMARKSRPASAPPDDVLRDLLQVLETNDQALAVAKTEYSVLLEKYPTSTGLHQTYAHFCDSVLNNNHSAEKHRKEARTLEGDDGDDGDDDPHEHHELHKKPGSELSYSIASSDNHRSMIAKSMTLFTDEIMGEEVHAMRVLEMRVRVGLAVLVVLAIGGFLITDLYLFSDVARRNLDLIDATGIFRTYAVSAAFLTRTQMLQSKAGDAAGVDAAKDTIYELMRKLRDGHLQNYEGLLQPRVKAFYLKEDKKLNVPFGPKWRVQEGSYWEIVNDFALRVERAGSATVEELGNQDWTPGNISEERTEIKFLHENIDRRVIPMFEEILEVYEQEVDDFGVLITAILWTNAGMNSMVLIVLFFLISRGLRYVMQTMHYKHLACVMALQLPPTIANNFDTFYRDLVTKMRAMEDEEMQAEQVIREGETPRQSRLPSLSGGDTPRRSRQASLSGGFLLRDGADEVQEPSGKSSPIDKFMNVMHDVKTEGDYKARVNEWDKNITSLAARAENLGSAEIALEKRAAGLRRNLQTKEDWGDAQNKGKLTIEVDGSMTASGHLASTRKEEDMGASGSSSTPFKPSSKLDATRVPREIEQDVPAERSSGLRQYEEPLTEPRNGSNLATVTRNGSNRNGVETVTNNGSKDDGAKKLTSIARNSSFSREESSFWIKRSEQKQYPTTFTSRTGETRRLVSPTDYRDMPAGTLEALRELVTSRNAWYSQTRTYVVAFVVVVSCCICSMGVPGRRVSSIVNMAPSVNQAGRRRFLTRACIHHSRELVLADGFSRLDAAGNAAALRYYLQELVAADHAIRLGGSKGIFLGADFRVKGGHNSAMYKAGCVWRENASDCSSVLMEGVASNGINFLFGTFVKAIETVLLRYDPTNAVPDFMDLSFMEDQGIDNIQEFNPIVVDPAKLDLLHSDREVHWLLNNFDGDMFSAFGLVLTIFHEETTTMIDEVHVEIRLLFSVYIVSIILLFYVSLFRRTCNAADAQAIRSREFVSMMPIYILSKTDANMVVQFFTPENDAEHDHRLSAKNLFENVDPAEKGDKEDKATEGGKRTTFHDHASKPHSYSEARDGQGLLLKGNSSSL